MRIWNGKLRRLSRRFHTLIWRPWDTVQNLSVKVSQIIRKNWQHCCLPNSFSKFIYVVWKKCLGEIFVGCEVVFFGPLLIISSLKLSSVVNKDMQIRVMLTKCIRHPLHSSFNRGVPWICFAVKMGRNSLNTCKSINLLFVWNVRALHQCHKHPLFITS